MFWDQSDAFHVDTDQSNCFIFSKWIVSVGVSFTSFLGLFLVESCSFFVFKVFSVRMGVSHQSDPVHVDTDQSDCFKFSKWFVSLGFCF